MRTALTVIRLAAASLPACNDDPPIRISRDARTGPADALPESDAGLNSGGPFAPGPRASVDAAASFIEGGTRVWAFTGGTIWIYDPARDRWLGDIPLATTTQTPPPVSAASVVPVWWGRRFGETDTADLALVRTGSVHNVRVNPLDRASEDGDVIRLAEAWADDPNAPPRLSVRASRLDLRNARGWEDRPPGDLCALGAGRATGPHTVLLAGDRYFSSDNGTCFEFWPPLPQGQRPGFRLPGAPDPASITAWTHAEPEAEGQGLDIVFVR